MAQLSFDIADWACWRRLLAGKHCPIAPVEISEWDWETGPFSPTVREALAGLSPVAPCCPGCTRECPSR